MYVRSYRGKFVETTHQVRCVAVQADVHHKTLNIGAYGPKIKSPWRSCDKPLQVWASIEAMTDQTFSDEELAIATASHSGQDYHLSMVNKLLDRFKATHDSLLCGAEYPAHEPSRSALIESNTKPSTLHNDCSGKHALMIGACRHQAWSDQYLDPEHPLQRRIKDLVTEWTEEQCGLAVDGCGVPTFHLSVEGMARAWCRLATTMEDGHFRGEVDERGASIGWAMQKHPKLVSGDNRIDLAIANRANEPYVGKIGALGVFGVALPQRRLGIAWKVSCGDSASLAVAVPAMLEQIAPGALAPAADWPWDIVKNVMGKTVGRRLVDWE